MKIISHEIPEIFYDCQRLFGVEWKDVIISYYPQIHAKESISEIKLAHELTHLSQQEKYGVKDWWGRYLQDKEFRLSEEVEAYTNEIAFIKGNVNNREICFKMIRQIYKDLSSSVYGNLVSYDEAKELLE